MLKYFLISIAFVAFVYVNVLGMFKGFKDVPQGEYRDFLWKHKKAEIIEKAVISAILVFVILSMAWTEELAMIALIAMALIMAVEYVFARFMRRSFVCPECGQPLWTGNYIVIIRCKKTCPHCGKVLYRTAAEAAAKEKAEAEELTD